MESMIVRGRNPATEGRYCGTPDAIGGWRGAQYDGIVAWGGGWRAFRARL